MPNCTICGKPVVSAPVCHPECWKEWAGEQARLELANIETALFKVLEV